MTGPLSLVRITASVKLLTPVVTPIVIAPMVVKVATATYELVVERFEDPLWEGLLVTRVSKGNSS